MAGYNGTMFAYGQTGCGKTHTMQGFSKDPEHRGVIPNSFEHIFENIKIATDKEFIVQASYMELYNEEIRDLLAHDPKHKLELKESPDIGVYVKDLTQKTVDNTEAMETLMDKGNEHRTTGSTLMNAKSSRSHSIFSIVIEVGEKREDGSDHITRGKLNLVDLAGSERPSKTGATGTRMKEGIKINLSLTALGNVISALVAGKHKHIPYRDSKLTRLLQDSLGGNTKTVMLAAVGPADYNYDETLSTLRYANRAKNIKNKPVLNEDPKDALLRQYKEEIEMLRQLLQQQLGTEQLNSILKSGQLPNKSLAAPSSPKKSARKSSQSTRSQQTKEKEEGQSQDQHEKGLQEKPDKQQQLVEQQTGNQNEGQHQQREHQSATDNDSRAENTGGMGGDTGQVEENEQNGMLASERTSSDAAKDDPQALKEKLASLMGKISKGGGEGEEDPDVVLAKQQHEYRRAQLKMKSQKKKEARLKAKQKQAEEEKEAMEAEMKNIASEAEAQSKAAKKLKSRYEKRIKSLQKDLQEAEEEWMNEKEGLTNTLKEQEKEIKLLEQVCSLFLKPPDMAKIWEKAVWNEETEEWTLPQVALKNARGARASYIGDASPNEEVSSRESSPDSASHTGHQSTLPPPTLRQSTSQVRASRGNHRQATPDMLPGINGGPEAGYSNRLPSGYAKNQTEGSGSLPSLGPVVPTKSSSRQSRHKSHDDSSLPPASGPTSYSRGRHIRRPERETSSSEGPGKLNRQTNDGQLPSMLPSLNSSASRNQNSQGINRSRGDDNFLPTL